MNISIRLGIKPEHKEDAAKLFALAFKKKLVNILGNTEQVIALLKDNFCLNQAITAVTENGEIVGIAGFQIKKVPLINLKYHDFVNYFGVVKGSYKFLLIYLIFDRKQDNKNQLLLNGIVVKDGFRGHGIGQKLIHELQVYAMNKNMDSIKLDVIDENPKAKKLYEKLGFRSVKHIKVPSFISRLINVTGVTTMIKKIK